MIQPKRKGQLAAAGYGTAFGIGPWLLEQLPRTHIPTRIYENAAWQLVWFEYVGDDPGVVRPTYPAWGLEALPADIVVDGEPLSAQPHPELWALHGAGWDKTRPGAKDRQLAAPGQLWLYTPRARTVEVRLTPASRGAWTLGVAVNGGAAQSLDVTRGRAVNLEVALASGWNEVMLTPGEAEPASGGSENAATLRIERIEIIT